MPPLIFLPPAVISRAKSAIHALHIDSAPRLGNNVSRSFANRGEKGEEGRLERTTRKEGRRIMSEEIKNPGTEITEAVLKSASAGESNTPPRLNDAELSGVSGGSFGPDGHILKLAKHYCNQCDRRGDCRRNDGLDLGYHIEGYGDPGSYTGCPYYDRARKE